MKIECMQMEPSGRPGTEPVSKGGEDVEEQLQQLIGKRVHVTFESKRHNGIYNLTGVLVGVDSQWSYFIDSVSDYPDGVFDFINTSRIRSVEEVEA